MGSQDWAPGSSSALPQGCASWGEPQVAHGDSGPMGPALPSAPSPSRFEWEGGRAGGVGDCLPSPHSALLSPRVITSRREPQVACGGGIRALFPGLRAPPFGAFSHPGMGWMGGRTGGTRDSIPVPLFCPRFPPGKGTLEEAAGGPLRERGWRTSGVPLSPPLPPRGPGAALPPDNHGGGSLGHLLHRGGRDLPSGVPLCGPAISPGAVVPRGGRRWPFGGGEGTRTSDGPLGPP